MSTKNVDTVLAVYEAFNRRDLDAMLAGSHPEIEIHDLPDLPEAETFHGHDGLRRMLALNTDPWESFSVDVERVVDLGDEVLVLVRDHLRARGGLKFEQQRGAIFALRDGLVAQVRYFSTHQEALEAAGLDREHA